jgi:flotillin
VRREKSRRTALADAEAIEGERRGQADKALRVAQAEALRAEGEAQASAILATGQAEAEAMNKRADAFARYNEAAVLQMLIEVLPKVAHELAAPMGSIDQLTVLSTEGAGALPKQVTDNLTQTMAMLKNTTGIDIQSIVQGFGDGSSTKTTTTTERPVKGSAVSAPSATAALTDE